MDDKHLSDEQIISFLQGTQPSANDETFRIHMEGCESCHRKLMDLAESQGLRPVDMPTTRIQAEDESHASGYATISHFSIDSNPGLLSQKDETPTKVGRYSVIDEIARGGMGVVVRADDTSLSRELAIKISLYRNDDHLDLRFREEARLTGQLQHPGIPPVHEVGSLSDGRPYFVMKLVGGQTLASLLRKNHGQDTEFRSALSIFEQVCQTLGYAHSLNIVHRDIKPANIMVGDFGEVQVMDWGLAKNLSDAGSPEEVGQTIARTPESDDDSVSATVSGTVLGTPTYMAPEQASGNIEKVDKQSDVFGLGALLCHILTGAPPFSGPSVDKVIASARECDTASAFEKLDKCGADETLISLAKRCLAKSKVDRPVDAAELAEAIALYHETVRQKLRETEVRRAQMEVQVEEDRKRRVVEQQRARLKLTLVATLLVIVSLIGCVAIWYQRDKAQRIADNVLAEQERNSRRERIVSDVESAINEASSIVDQLEGTLADERKATHWLSSIDEWQDQVELAIAAIDSGSRVAQADIELLSDKTKSQLALAKDRCDVQRRHFGIAKRLDEIRMNSFRPGLSEAMKISAAKLSVVFEEHGIMPTREDEVEAAAVKIKDSPIRFAWLAALDQWLANPPTKSKEQRLLVLRLIRAVDNDPWRNTIRMKRITGETREELAELLAEVDVAKQSPQLLVALMRSLPNDQSLAFGRRCLLAHPGDFFLTHRIAFETRVSTEREGWFHAALAIRPRSAVVWNNLVYTLNEAEKWEEAIRASRRVLELAPDYANGWANLGNALFEVGRHDEALEAHRKAIRLETDDSIMHTHLANLATTLVHFKEYEEALSLASKAVALQPDFANGQSALGLVYMQMGRHEEAIKAMRIAAKLDPTRKVALSVVLTTAGRAMQQMNEHAKATPYFREAIELDPGNASALLGMGVTTEVTDGVDKALELYRKAAVVDPKKVEAPLLAGMALNKTGRVDEAIEMLRAAVKVGPNDSEALYSLAVVLQSKGKLNEPIELYSRAIKHDPDHGKAYFNLGTIRLNQNRLRESIPLLKRSHELMPKELNPMSNLGKALMLAGRYSESLEVKRRALKLHPSATTHAALGVSLLYSKAYPEAEEQYRAAVKLDPRDVKSRRGLAYALLEQKKFFETLKAYRDLLKLVPRDLEAHQNIGMMYFRIGNNTQAIDALRKARKLGPKNAKTLRLLAQVLVLSKVKEHQDEAFELYKELVKVIPNDRTLLFNLAGQHLKRKDYASAEEHYREAIRVDPLYWTAHENLGLALERQKRFKDAIGVYRNVIKSAPDRVLAHWSLGLALKGDKQLGPAKSALEQAARLQPSNLQLANDLKRVSQWLSFEKDAEAIAKGSKTLQSPAEYADFASFSIFHSGKKLDAIRAFQKAFEDLDKLSDQAKLDHLYNAACCVALTISDKAKASDELSDEEITQFRGLALEWLTTDLELFQKLIDKDSKQASRFRDRVRHWLQDSDMIAFRATEKLTDLPEAERKQWITFWSEVRKVANSE